MRPLLLLIFFFLSSLVYGQADPAAFSVKGFLPYWKGASITLRVNGAPVYAQTLQQDVFSYTGQTPAAQTGLLEIRESGKPHFLSFFVEPGVIRVRDKGSKRLEIYGTPTNDSFLALNQRFDSLVLNGRSGPSGVLTVTKRDLAKAFIRSHPGSIISLQLLYDHFYLKNAVDDSAYAALFELLDPDLQQTTLGQKMEKEVIFSSQSAIGVKAVALDLPDTAGVLRPVYTRGDYTLVHFWASWCIPCKKELPELLALHREFAPKGLMISGVSLDRDSTAWKFSARYLPGKQLIDRGSFSGVSARNYGVRVVPTNLLLNREGTIIAKNLNMPDLEKKLHELLDAKTF